MSVVLRAEPTRARSTASSERSPAVILRRQIVGLLLLGSAGVVLLLSWVMLWPVSYRLTHGNDFTYQYLVAQPDVWHQLYQLLVLADKLAPGIEPPQNLDILVNALMITFIVSSVGYLGGVLLLDLGISRGRGALLVVLGVEALSQVLLLLLPGLFTTDIFSYVMYGHIAGIYNLNPYIYPPSFFPANPMLNWIHPIWHNTPSVYGFVWTDLSWVFAKIINPLEPIYQVFAYKLLMGVVNVVNLVLIWVLLRWLRPGDGSDRARLTAFTAFAWNPLVLFDLVGNAHNDAVMLTLFLLGIVPLAWGARRVQAAVGASQERHQPSNLQWVWGCLLVALSALVKYTTGLIGLFYVVAWARQIKSWRGRTGWIVGTGILIVLVTAVLGLPWLQREAIDPMLNAAEGPLYTNSVPDLLSLTIADQIINPAHVNSAQTQDAVRFWMKVVTKAIFLLYLLWECWHLWRAHLEDRRAIVSAVVAASTRALLVLSLLVLMWVLDWYFTWPLALAVLLGWDRLLTKVTAGYTLTVLPVFYYHNYWDDYMPGWVVLLYAIPPLLLPLVAWLNARFGPALRARLSPGWAAWRSGAQPAAPAYWPVPQLETTTRPRGDRGTP